MKQLELREESGWVQTPNKDKPVQTCWTPPGSLVLWTRTSFVQAVQGFQLSLVASGSAGGAVCS